MPHAGRLEATTRDDVVPVECQAEGTKVVGWARVLCKMMRQDGPFEWLDKGRSLQAAGVTPTGDWVSGEEGLRRTWLAGARFT